MIVFLPYSSCCFHQKPSCFRGSPKLQAHATAFHSYTEHYIDANLEEAGDCIERLEDESKRYLAMVEKKDLDYKKLHQQGMCKLIHFTCTDSLHMYDNCLLYSEPESSHFGDVTLNVLPTGERVLIIDVVKVV